jgi:hypothetical protein
MENVIRSFSWEYLAQPISREGGGELGRDGSVCRRCGCHNQPDFTANYNDSVNTALASSTLLPRQTTME